MNYYLLRYRNEAGRGKRSPLDWAGLGWAGLPGLAGCVFLNWKNWENWKVCLGKIVETPEKSKKIESWVGSPPRKSYVITRKSVNSGLFFFFSLVSAKALGCVGCGPKKHTSRTPRQTDGFLWRGVEVGRDPKATNQGLWFILGRYGNTNPTGREGDFRGEGAPPAPATRGGTAPIAGNKNWNPTG